MSSRKFNCTKFTVPGNSITTIIGLSKGLPAVYNYCTFFFFICSSGAAFAFHKSKKFLVFEECLLSLFKNCKNCGNTKTSTFTHIVGTLVTIKQECSICLNRFEWNSQPILKQGPAGNILLSASILFSGSLPTKVLRVLNIFGCATISRNTYFRHEESLLQPCIFSVWKEHQNAVFKELCEEKRPLVCQNGAKNIHILNCYSL